MHLTQGSIRDAFVVWIIHPQTVSYIHAGCCGTQASKDASCGCGSWVGHHSSYRQYVHLIQGTNCNPCGSCRVWGGSNRIAHMLHDCVTDWWYGLWGHDTTEWSEGTAATRHGVSMVQWAADKAVLSVCCFFPQGVGVLLLSSTFQHKSLWLPCIVPLIFPLCLRVQMVLLYGYEQLVLLFMKYYNNDTIERSHQYITDKTWGIRNVKRHNLKYIS